MLRKEGTLARKTVQAILGFGMQLGLDKALNHGVFVSAGIGKDSEGRTEYHFHATSWERRFEAAHQPEIRAEIVETEFGGRSIDG